MALNTRVAVSGHDRQKTAFNLPARATGLNKHGAALQLNRELPVGTRVVVRNGRGDQAQARVVTQVNAAQGAYTYGVEFVKEETGQTFWGITFPSTV